jgi:hypothetical protein
MTYLNITELDSDETPANRKMAIEKASKVKDAYIRRDNMDHKSRLTL